MGKLDYSAIEKKALDKIRNKRAEYASAKDQIGEEAINAMNSITFDFYTDNHADYTSINYEVEKYLMEMLEAIIVTLFNKFEVEVSTNFAVKTNEGMQSSFPIMKMFEPYKVAPLFVIIKIENTEPVLYSFRKYGLQNKMHSTIMEDILRRLGVKKYHEVSLVGNYAYSENINHNDDGNDESRGTNIYSLKWFFETNFGEEEYQEFKTFEKSLTEKIKECLGFSIVKTLTPNALFSFKKSVEEEIINYPYEKSISSASAHVKDEFDKLKKQYITDKYYKALTKEGTFISYFKVEGCEFSESFITSEWLYQSLATVGKVDLTAIAMGYFKSIEQLLYVFVSAHVGERKWIETDNKPKDWMNYQPKDRYWRKPVNVNTIKNKKQYIMLERMITFIKEYDDLFTDTEIRDYLVERIYDAKQLRNGYFHKDNLSEMEKVKKARDAAYVIYMLLFGAMNISEQGKEIIGIPKTTVHYEMLCDYIHYHHDVSYYFEDVEGNMVVTVGQPDNGIVYDISGNATYSGVYFNQFVDFPADKPVLGIKDMKICQKQKLHFTKSNMPLKIYQGTFVVCKEGILISGPKKLIWDKGIFLADQTN